MANFILDDFKRIMSGKNYLQKLILINAVVFVFLNIALVAMSGPSGETLIKFIALPSGLLPSLKKVWTFFTYMFIHKDFFHILFNMLWLYWLGRIFTDIYGTGRLLNLYLFGGLAGGLLFVIVSALPGFIPPGVSLIGASGGVLAVMVGTGVLLPNYELRLLFFGNVKLKYLALVGFILSTVLDFNVNTGGKIAHIGGALFGLIYGGQLKKGIEITDGPVKFFRAIIAAFKPGAGNNPDLKVVHRNTSRSKAKMSSNPKRSGFSSTHEMSPAEKQEKIDSILDKISKSGYDSLSKSEKDFLFRASKD